MLQQTLLYILTFVSGTFFGSFLNLVSDRVVKEEKIFLGRSKCDHCKKPLGPKNLVPLFSFIFQKGKCAFCKKKLSWYYPFSEILTGLMFVGTAYMSKVLIQANVSTVILFVYLAVVGSFYIIIFLTDLKYKIIPNKVIYPAIIFVTAYIVISTTVFFVMYYNQLKGDNFGVYLLEAGYLKMQLYTVLQNIGTYYLSATGIALFFAFLVFITKGRGMGGGDIKLGFFIGIFNGFPLNIIAIFLGFVLGAFVSLVLVMLKIRTLKDTVPFGPFLIVGSIIALLWGADIWNLYLGLLN